MCYDMAGTLLLRTLCLKLLIFRSQLIAETIEISLSCAISVGLNNNHKS